MADYSDIVELSDFEVSPFGPPCYPGVYAIYAINGILGTGVKHLLYIGSSQNIKKRISSQKHPYFIAFNRLSGRVYTAFYETKEYMNVEKQLIKKHKPILNVQWR